MRAVVYTAIFGGYDTLKRPVPQDEPCDFICFTDARIPSRPESWRIVHVGLDQKFHPRIQAKQFKLLSHSIFPGGRLAWRYAPFSLRRSADLSIWVDASLQIKSASFVRDLRAALGERDWAMFVHPERDCIYDEARFSAEMIKYRGLPVIRQVEAYKSIVPPHGGLYAGGNHSQARACAGTDKKRQRAMVARESQVDVSRPTFAAICASQGFGMRAGAYSRTAAIERLVQNHASQRRHMRRRSVLVRYRVETVGACIVVGN